MPRSPGSRPRLSRDHPVGAAFLDETGIISKDRFFGVGVLKCQEPSRLLRRIQTYRDQKHWYGEIKFTSVRKHNLHLYKDVVDICLGSGFLEFFCFIADRDTADPIARFGTEWDAYGKLAEQLVVAAMHPDEVIALLADNYSTPAHVLFEEHLRAAVNRRLHRLAVVTVCRLDSKSSDGLQVADLLTSAVAHEFRADAGLALPTSAKGQLAAYVRTGMGTSSCLSGWRNITHSVAIYDHGSWVPVSVKP